jgi:hypothetical protein
MPPLAVYEFQVFRDPAGLARIADTGIDLRQVNRNFPLFTSAEEFASVGSAAGRPPDIGTTGTLPSGANETASENGRTTAISAYFTPAKCT